MYQVEHKVTIGQDEFLVKVNADSQTDLIQKLSFFTNLPKVGPNGETDLRLNYRNVKGYEFYSLVSDIAGKEFKLGQYKENAGALFPKGWSDVYVSEDQGAGQGQDVSAEAAQTPRAASAARATVATTRASAPRPQTNIGPQASPAVKQAANATLAKYGITK